MEGSFYSIDARAVCKVSANTDLLSATHAQSTFSLRNCCGDMVSFYFPSYLPAVNVPGFHSHFLSKDCTMGGHVMGFKAKNISVSVALAEKLEIIMPQDKSWQETNIPVDPSEILNRAEKARKKS